jgi:putative membrane protein
MKIIFKISVTALTLLFVSNILPDIKITSAVSAIIASLVLGILNTLVRPILVILTFPITILTLGLFGLIINASMFYLTADLVSGFYVGSFWQAILGSIIVSTVSAFTNRFVK